MQKNVAILFGGKSAEHEVSVQSAKNILDALDRNKYHPILIGIDKDGIWRLTSEDVLNAQIAKNGAFEPHNAPSAALIPGSGGILLVNGLKSPAGIDVVFPVLHGPFGEDGTVQGLLKLADIPFVGTSVLASAVSMDKDVMKRLLRDAGLPIGKFLSLKSYESLSFTDAVDELGIPFFVKPANMGSSVGVAKVHSAEEFGQALAQAFDYDTKIVLEEFIPGREIECSVLGNEEPLASLPGEIVSSREFYSYGAKYLDESGVHLEIPAKLPPKTIKIIQDLAVKVFKTLCCEGLGRVDFFLKPDGVPIINEINAMPGFTKISMYPKLWESTGLSYSTLIDRLITLAMSRFEKEKRLKTSFF
ncbi:MAG: D-alanine--D-alanine ligase [Treponema sp.]|jgi:D-alanine-D-alanine ligase|nr:D-alanine--D-alanine ligase [Treponema sp.]